MATRIQAEINQQKKVLPLEEQVSKEFHDFLDVFSEEKAARFPESRPWDHKIEMKDTFVPKSFKTYNLIPQEQIELDKFLKENLEKAISGHLNPQWHLHSSLLTRKMGNSEPVKIINILMNIQSKMLILYPSLRNYWTSSKGLNDSPS